MRVLSVREVNRLIAETLAANPYLQQVLVEGEIREIRVRGSHVFYTLTDGQDHLPCVFFGGAAGALPREGDMLLVLGRIRYYGPQGRLRLYTQRWQSLGEEGRLRRQLREIVARLRADGLLTEQRGARPLPRLPGTVGLLTSRESAAFRDVLRVAWRRFPGARFLLYHVQVQGEGAVEQLLEGLRRLQEFPIDVLLIVRGGGSAEDLHAFNSEALARAIAASRVPVVTGIGHEIDTTIADLVADHRAATPSQAAELIFPEIQELRRSWLDLRNRLFQRAESWISELEAELSTLRHRLEAQSPGDYIHRMVDRVQELEERLTRAVDWELEKKARDLQRLLEGLRARDPQAILRRGYAMVFAGDRLIASAREARREVSLQLQFADGRVAVRTEGENSDGDGI